MFSNAQPVIVISPFSVIPSELVDSPETALSAGVSTVGVDGSVISIVNAKDASTSFPFESSALAHTLCESPSVSDVVFVVVGMSVLVKSVSNRSVQVMVLACMSA